MLAFPDFVCARAPPRSPNGDMRRDATPERRWTGPPTGAEIMVHASVARSGKCAEKTEVESGRIAIGCRCGMGE